MPGNPSSEVQEWHALLPLRTCSQSASSMREVMSISLSGTCKYSFQGSMLGAQPE